MAAMNSVALLLFQAHAPTKIDRIGAAIHK